MLNYPLDLSFKIVSFGPQVRVCDASGRLIAYVKQRALRLREDVRIYADEGRQRQLYQINASRILDFRANYVITTAGGEPVGAVHRPGIRSIWQTNYLILDTAGAEIGLIHEENPWVKVVDGLVGEVPVLGMLTGMFLNPAFLVDLRGRTVLYLKKQPAVFESKFTIERRGDFSDRDEALLLSSAIMTMLMERDRG